MIRVNVFTNDKDNKSFELLDSWAGATFEGVCNDIQKLGAYSIRLDDTGKTYKTYYLPASIYRVVEVTYAGTAKQ